MHDFADRAARESVTDPLPAGAGDGKILFLDAFSGIAGDMLVAACLDLGVPIGAIDEVLSSLPVQDFEIEHASVTRSGIVGRRFQVHPQAPQPDRSHADIQDLLEFSRMPDGARRLAQEAFAVLAEAESAVHRVPAAEVQFHEVGALDSIVDIVAAAVALDWIGAEIIASPLPLGHGTVEARHGILPLPAPATVECLRQVPTYAANVEAELVTPTGACLVAAAAAKFSRWPAMRPERIGWGAGTRDLPDRPNLLRVVLGSPSDTARRSPSKTELSLIETNIDDSTPEVIAHAVERVLESGAIDAWTTSIGMKKGRPGVKVTILARATEAEAIAGVLMQETSTLGVRLRPVNRIERPRSAFDLDTPFGRITVKVALGDGLSPHYAPEFESCKQAAARHEVPIKEVFAAALMSARQRFGEH